MSHVAQAIAALWRRYMQLGLLMKLVSGLSAIIGLGFAIVHVYSSVTGEIARRQSVVELTRLADRELTDHEYNAAWAANAKAIEAAPKDERVLAQQAQVAMRWLDDMRLSSKPGAKSFTDVVAPLEDTLNHRAESVKGRELADVKAHIGWARFLRSRDGVTGLRVTEAFSEALAIDPQNMYAHAMRGLVTLWNGGSMDAARKDFDAALTSDVAPNYRDGMILAAFFNSTADPSEFAAVDYANKIRKAGRPIDGDSKGRLLRIYSQGLHGDGFLGRLAQVMPAADHIATLDWLLQDDTNPQRQGEGRVLKGYFLESSGDKPAALALYKDAAASLGPDNVVTDFARGRIARLTESPNNP